MPISPRASSARRTGQGPARGHQGGPVFQQRARDQGQRASQQQGRDEHARQGGQAGGGQQAARRGTARRAQAPQAVERGQQRPSPARLDGDPLSVDGHVRGALRGTEDQQGQDQGGQGGGQHGQGQGGAVGQPQDADRPAAAPPGDQAAGQGHGQQRPDGRGQQGEAQGAGAQAEGLLHRGDERHPGGEDGPVDEEGGEDSPAGAPHRRGQRRGPPAGPVRWFHQVGRHAPRGLLSLGIPSRSITRAGGNAGRTLSWYEATISLDGPTVHTIASGRRIAPISRPQQYPRPKAYTPC